MSEETKETVKAILYTDGGYRSKYNSGGWGVHGYTFKDEKPTKGTGNPKAIPTNMGYAADKSDPDSHVTITSYIEGVGGVHKAHSSNHTELEATTKALDWISKNDIHHAKIYSDSRYVIDGLSQWVDKWKMNGWKNGEGQPVANKTLWCKASDLYNQLKENGKEVDLFWIKGHAGHFGNEMADTFASIGNVLGRKQDDHEQFITVDPSGYWSKKNNYNRMLASGRWYFQTTDDDIFTEDGKTIYYIGDHGSDDDLLGKKMTDGGMSVLYLNEPDIVLEALRHQAKELDVRKFGSVMIGRLDNILNPSVYDEITKNGTKFLDWDTSRLDVVTAQRKPLLKERSPAGLAYIAVDLLTSLQSKLDAYRNKDLGVIVTEITDHFFDSEEKKGKVSKKIKSDITQTTKYMTFDTRYSTSKVSQLTGPDDPSIKTQAVKLIFGQDLPKRNTLSNLVGNDPKVFVITWRESEVAFRFAAILECDLGIGIWSGVESNFLLVK